MKDNPQACVILIGNEVLSGRTQDQNLNYLAKALLTVGIRIHECRIIADDESAIVTVINDCRAKYDYVFTTGGIGPTHDDITAAAIAKAFGVNLYRNQEAVDIMKKYKGGVLHEASLKMADIPEGSALIQNPVTAAPGFIKENVYVMAGIPAVMQGMIETLLPSLKKGKPVYSESIWCNLPESKIAFGLDKIQKEYADLEIGSYPHWTAQTDYRLNLVVRGADKASIKQAMQTIEALIADLESQA